MIMKEKLHVVSLSNFNPPSTIADKKIPNSHPLWPNQDQILTTPFSVNVLPKKVNSTVNCYH